MKPMVVTILVAFVGSFGVAPSAWAKCGALYAQAQALIRQAENQHKDPQILEEARRCAETGLKRHQQGRHPESMKTLRQCMKRLKDTEGVEKGQGER